MTDDPAGTFCTEVRAPLVGALTLYCGDRGVAEELAQEALARALQRWDTIEHPRPWTYATAFNLARSRFRRVRAERRARDRIARLAGEGTVDPDTASAMAVRDAVRARATAAERRRRRTAVGAMVAVVALAGVLVVPALLNGSGGVRPSGVADLVPLSEWPTSIDFAGVEIEVEVTSAPEEAPQARVALGNGEAGLSTGPHEPSSDGVARFRPRTWFGCGTGEVVRLVADGRASGAQPFEIPSPGRDWLPPGALLEAARQLTVQMGCTPVAPPGTPDAVSDGQSWLGSLAAAMDAAGMSSCCVSTAVSPDWVATDQLDHVGDWGVLLPEGDRLFLSVATSEVSYFDEDPARLVPLGEGSAVQQAIPNRATAVLWFDCEGASVRAQSTSGEVAPVARFVGHIGCTPTVPLSIAPNAALGALLTDLGGELIASPRAQGIAQARIILDGVELEVRSGGMSQLGLSPDTVVELNRGWQALDPELDGHGAVALCGVTHAIRAGDADGVAAALALAERIVAHPDCSLDSGFEIPTSAPEIGAVEPEAPPSTSDPTAAPVPAEAATVIEALQAAGRWVGEVIVEPDATTFHVQPEIPGASPVWMSLDRDPVWSPTGDSTLVQLAGGEAVVLERAIDALGSVPCCGEPSHGGSGAATGLVWEGAQVFLSAGPPMTASTGYQVGEVIAFAGGEADLGDGDGLPVIAFDCGDSSYQLSHDSTTIDVHLRAAEALAGQLGCVPRVG